MSYLLGNFDSKLNGLVSELQIIYGQQLCDFDARIILGHLSQRFIYVRIAHGIF